MLYCIFAHTFLNIWFRLFFLGVASTFIYHFVNQDPGAQVPTNVTGMLKFGTNLLQAVGQFNGKYLKLLFFPVILVAFNICILLYYNHYHCEGRYVVLVAYMSVTPLLEDPVLQDYLQPAVTSVDLGIIWIFRMNCTIKKTLRLFVFYINPLLIIHYLFAFI